MLEVTLTSAIGKTYLLTGSTRTSPVLAPVEALTPLSGTVSRSDLAVPGRSGVIPGRARFEPIQADVEFYLHADTGEQMERVYREFRQGWSKSIPSTLRVNADHPLGAFFLDLWLGQPLAGVPVDMRRRTQATVVASVFSPKGLFRSAPLSGEGEVTVSNMGDEIIYPRVGYEGEGGEVVSPSGARFTLPPVAEYTVIDLDPRRLRLDGAFPEGVPAGESGTWILPEGATLLWHVEVADPWA